MQRSTSSEIIDQVDDATLMMPRVDDNESVQRQPLVRYHSDSDESSRSKDSDDSTMDDEEAEEDGNDMLSVSSVSFERSFTTSGTTPSISEMEEDPETSQTVEIAPEDNLPARPVNNPLHLPISEVLNRRMYGMVNVPPSRYSQMLISNFETVRRLTLAYSMYGHDGCVNSLAFNSCGTRLASGSDDLNVIIWDWAMNRALTKFHTGHRWNVFQSKFLLNADDLEIVTASRDGQVRLAELGPDGSCRSTRRLAHHSGPVHKVALSEHCPNVILSCAEDGQVLEIDLRRRRAKKLFILEQSQPSSGNNVLYSVQYNPRNPNLFLVSGDSRHCRVYDRRFVCRQEPLQVFSPTETMTSEVGSGVTCAVYNHSGTEILAAYQGNNILLFDANQQDACKKFHGYSNNVTIKGVNFYGPQSELVISGSDCGHVFLWDKVTSRVIRFARGDVSGAVNVLEPNPTCSTLATSGIDHEVKIWKPSGDPVPLDEATLSRVVLSNEAETEENTYAGEEVQVIYEHFTGFLSNYAFDGDQVADGNRFRRSYNSSVECRPS